MKFGLEQFKKIFFLLSLRTHIHLERREGIMLGAYGLMLIFAALMVWDGFLFYTSILYPRSDFGSPTPPKSKIVSSRQLEEVTKLLDTRKHALQEILNGNAATTTPAQ